MHDFSMNLANIAFLPQRLLKTANLLKQLTDSVGVKLYLTDSVSNEIYFCPTGEVDWGVHRVAWQIGTRINNYYIYFILFLSVTETGKTIAAHVAFSKEYVLVNDIFGDDRFPEGVGWSDLTITSIIGAPVITRNQECSAVIELYRDNGVDYIQV